MKSKFFGISAAILLISFLLYYFAFPTEPTEKEMCQKISDAMASSGFGTIFNVSNCDLQVLSKDKSFGKIVYSIKVSFGENAKFTGMITYNRGIGGFKSGEVSVNRSSP